MGFPLRVRGLLEALLDALLEVHGLLDLGLELAAALVLELAVSFPQPRDFGLGIERSLLPVHFRLCGHELESWERCAAELI